MSKENVERCFSPTQGNYEVNLRTALEISCTEGMSKGYDQMKEKFRLFTGKSCVKNCHRNPIHERKNLLRKKLAEIMGGLCNSKQVVGFSEPK